MPTYVALLRGINLAGRAKVRMDDLRQLFAALGHADAKTYLQSGNVIFTCPVKAPSRLATDIEKRIARDLGLTVTVLLRTHDDLKDVVANNPFLSRKPDSTKLRVTFLADKTARDRLGRLETPGGETDEFSLAGREVHVHCPDGYGRTKLNNAFFEKRLGVAATTRNWKTVTKLHDLTCG